MKFFFAETLPDFPVRRGVLAATLIASIGCGGVRESAMVEAPPGGATAEPTVDEDGLRPLPAIDIAAASPAERRAGACDWSGADAWESPGESSAQLAAVGCSLFAVGVAPLREGPFMRRLDLGRGSWRDVPFTGARRQYLGLASDGDRLFVAGGMTGALRSTLQVGAFDPASESWQNLPSLPASAVPHPEATGLEGVALFFRQGRLYAFGGRWSTHVLRDRGDGTLDASVGRSVGAYVHELGTSGWRELPAIPSPTAFASALWLDDRIWLVGGADDPRLSPVKDVFSFDLATESWRREPSMPRPSAGGALVVDGRIYAFPSYVFDRGGPQIFDATTGTWRETRRRDRDPLRGGPVSIDGRIVIEAKGRLVEYRPATDTWHPLGRPL